MPVKFIYINVAVFVVVKVAGLVMTLSGVSPGLMLRYLEMPSVPWMLLRYPWTVLTYMFTHYDLLHILFNMLFLYWFGALFLQFFSQRQFVGLYLIGGVGGAVFYLLAYNLLPYFSGVVGMMLGASASILAVVVATAVRAPDYKIRLFLIGAISLKWLAIITIFLDLISIGSDNSGGHIAHIGGAAVGLLFGLCYRGGLDITAPVNAVIDWVVNLFRRRPSVRVGDAYRRRWWQRRPEAAASSGQPATGADPAERERAEAEMDAILDKIKKSGYKALTADEKRRLFETTKKL